jgi:hypothetical protein
MDSLLTLLRSKTVYGALLIGAAQLPMFVDYRDQMMGIGLGLFGVGIAHKLDKIKDAASNQGE